MLGVASGLDARSALLARFGWLWSRACCSRIRPPACASTHYLPAGSRVEEKTGENKRDTRQTKCSRKGVQVVRPRVFVLPTFICTIQPSFLAPPPPHQHNLSVPPLLRCGSVSAPERPKEAARSASAGAFLFRARARRVGHIRLSCCSMMAAPGLRRSTLQRLTRAAGELAGGRHVRRALVPQFR